jgi:hypothetical protein
MMAKKKILRAVILAVRQSGIGPWHEETGAAFVRSWEKLPVSIIGTGERSCVKFGKAR